MTKESYDGLIERRKRARMAQNHFLIRPSFSASRRCVIFYDMPIRWTILR